MRNDRGHTEDALDAQEERTGILLAISTIFTDTKTWTIGLTLLDYCYSPQASVFARHAYARLRTPFGRALCIALFCFLRFLVPMHATHCTILHLPYGLPHSRLHTYCTYVSQHPPFRTYCTRTCHTHSCSIVPAPVPRTSRTPTSRTVRMDRYQYIRITRTCTWPSLLANTAALRILYCAVAWPRRRDHGAGSQDPKLSFSSFPGLWISSCSPRPPSGSQPFTGRS